MFKRKWRNALAVTIMLGAVIVVDATAAHAVTTVTLILTAANPWQCLTAQGVTGQTGNATVVIVLP